MFRKKADDINEMRKCVYTPNLMVHMKCGSMFIKSKL